MPQVAQVSVRQGRVGGSLSIPLCPRTRHGRFCSNFQTLGRLSFNLTFLRRISDSRERENAQRPLGRRFAEIATRKDKKDRRPVVGAGEEAQGDENPRCQASCRGQARFWGAPSPE